MANHRNTDSDETELLPVHTGELIGTSTEPPLFCGTDNPGQYESVSSNTEGYLFERQEPTRIDLPSMDVDPEKSETDISMEMCNCDETGDDDINWQKEYENLDREFAEYVDFTHQANRPSLPRNIAEWAVAGGCCALSLTAVLLCTKFCLYLFFGI